MPDAAHPLAANAHAAMHPPWTLSDDSAIWIEDKPVAPNLVSIGKEMCMWLQQRGQLTICREDEKGVPFAHSNPYTYSASSIGIQMAIAIDAAVQFSESDLPLAAIEAEFQRLRLENELKLNFARFCESSIKQMLFCTNLKPKLYKNAAMGELLALDCKACRKVGKPHFVSLLGALAHRYFRCAALESCLFEHLAFAGTRRTKEAAHADAPAPVAKSAEEARRMAGNTVHALGKELGHLCEHIGEIEEKMLAEIGLRIANFPEVPPLSDLCRVGIRFTQEEKDFFNSRD